ncbi:hypothetical protein K458DRAFT_455383 [Lentithecium fluviatile CBS 122367]|uniref:Alpha/beta-hydrolase n=1 Tax=Lentithecium fluviatile CBS 122367 TaxID=1168545 RepID=A0A6G1JLV1_9PLEO|nr:hypothetical protein K458DRAFT_455383 [Lentithecium fluviatile CBS 122367]
MPGKYNLIKYTLDEGCRVFSHDILGCGASSSDGLLLRCYITNAAIAVKSEIAGAVTLTSISLTQAELKLPGLAHSYVSRIANVENPALYGDRDCRPTLTSLPSHRERKAQPFPVGEFLSFASPTGTSAEERGKPALHITGEKECIVCDGWCPRIFEGPAKMLYGNAKPLHLSIRPGASHRLNLHKNAAWGLEVVTRFLGSNGL